MRIQEKNRQRKGTRRVVSLLLLLVLFAQLLPWNLLEIGHAADAVTVTENGAEISAVTLPQSGRVTLEASCDTEDPAYQWQILLGEDWADIQDATDKTLTLTYPVVESALSGGVTQVRCSAGEESFSRTIRVTVRYEAREGTTAQEPTKKTQVAAKRKALAAPQTAPEYVNISVNYLDEGTKLPVYTGFSATIKSGEPYSQTVLSPTYLGYAPYYCPEDPGTEDPGKATTSAQRLELAVSAEYASESYTVNVYYKAVEVPYGVRYYFQNIQDDQYTENTAVYRQSRALTGTIISNEDLLLDSGATVGFTKLYHAPQAVAADGSTVFECYYDRNYYQVKLDANGGYGSEHIYARYGTPFAAVDPTRPGYLFAGWDKQEADGSYDGVADALPGTVPAENTSYRALWKSGDTTYSVVYWLKKPQANDKSATQCEADDVTCVGSVTMAGKAGETVNANGIDDAMRLQEGDIICGNSEHMADPTLHTDSCKVDSGLRHYVLDDADRNVVIEGDGSTIINVIYSRREYTLRFYYGHAWNDKGTPRYYVVGGSTYNFGNINRTCPSPSQYSDEKLLEMVRAEQGTSVWGEVEVSGNDMSSLIDPAYHSRYKLGTLPEDGSYNSAGHKYYYLEFTAPYGADLSDLWPSDVFEKVPLTDTEKQSHTKNGGTDNLTNDGWGNYAYFAGWNGEYNVKYTQDHKNSTIKCYIPVLDDTVLYAESRIASYGDPDKVSFLGFFDNGANFAWSKPIAWHYELYLPTLYNEPGDLEKDGVNYTLYKTLDTNDDNGDIAHQTCPPLPGFIAPDSKDGTQLVNEDKADGRKSMTAQYFYTRQSYTLSMRNHTWRSTESVLYGDDLDDWVTYLGSPVQYPSTFEKNAYTFSGWYTTPGHYEGSEYTTGQTMPAHNVALYAGWVPVQHTVKLFRSQADLKAYQTTGEESLVYETRVVDHGTAMGEMTDPVDPSGHGYDFGGWFYDKNGKKTALTTTDTIITDDLYVYAEWSNHTAQPYLIHYILDESESGSWKELLNAAALYSPVDGQSYTVTDNAGERRSYLYTAEDGGYHRQIADDTRGYANQGSTRTFYPKAGDPYHQLYEGFDAGYYPTLASHSLTMEEESGGAAPAVNVFSFRYVYAATVSYKVEYRYQNTGELIVSDSTGTGEVYRSTNKAVVTERFAVVQDYLPDGFYKRLILAVVKGEDGTYVGSPDNVITFYYTKDTSKAFYAVHYMLQNVDATADEPDQLSPGIYSNYTETTAHMEGIGEIGTTLRITPQQFDGFTMRTTAVACHSDNQYEVQQQSDAFPITITAEGTELYVFYTRESQSYTAYYLRYGADISDLTALDSEDVLSPAKTGTGKYGELITETAESIDGFHCVSPMSQSIVLRSDNGQNSIIFYYEPLQYTAEYRVWVYGGGTLSRTLEVVDGAKDFLGSMPTADSGYRFTGWYLDEECTQPADERGTVFDSGLLKPQRGDLDPAPQTNVFYAQFKAVYGDLTISRSAQEDESSGDRVFIYRVTSLSDPTFSMEVTVDKGSSTTIYALPCGEYTVTQENGWSWRYSDKEQTAQVQEEKNTTVIFDGVAVANKWLSGNSDAKVNRKG